MKDSKQTGNLNFKQLPVEDDRTLYKKLDLVAEYLYEKGNMKFILGVFIGMILSLIALLWLHDFVLRGTQFIEIAKGVIK